MNKVLHDLNNQISIIQLSTRLLQSHLSSEVSLTPKVEKYLKNIVEAAKNSVDLTRKLAETQTKDKKTNAPKRQNKL